MKNILKENNINSLLFSLLFTGLYYYGDIVVFKQTDSIFKYLLIFIAYLLSFKIYLFLTKPQKDKDYIIPYLNQKNLFIFFLIVYIPHVLIKYPVALDVDAYLQLNQTLGTDTLTTHWPLFHTLLMTYFYKFGELLGDHNIGMFILSIIETIIYSSIYSYVINKLYELKFPKIIIYLSIIYYAFNPMIMASNGTVLKDGMYCALLLLLCTLLIQYIDNKNIMNDKKYSILLFLVSFFLPMFRNNGTYVVVPVLIVLFILQLKNSYRNKLLIIICIIAPILFSNVLKISFNAKDGSRREIFSLPFQQTARLVKYHEELITDEEKAIISKVLDYDKIAEVYLEEIADPVKYLFNDQSSTSDIINYLLVWFKQLFKAPLTYIEATSRQNIYAAYPRLNIFQYNVECNGGYTGGDQSIGYLQTPLWLKNNQHYYFSILEIMHKIPVLSLLTNPAIYTIFFFVSLVTELGRKTTKKKLVFLPLLLSFLIMIVGPVIINFPRYMYPFVYTTPIWIGILIKEFS